MKKRSKTILGASVCLATIASSITIPTATIENTLQKNEALKETNNFSNTENIISTKFGRDFSGMTFSYDDKVLNNTEIKGVVVAGNEDIISSQDALVRQHVNYNQQLHDRHFSAAIAWDDTLGGYRYYKATASDLNWHACNSLDIPTWAASIDYHKLDNFSSKHKDDDFISKDHLLSKNNRYYYQDSSSNGNIPNHNKKFAGVVQILAPHYVPEIPSSGWADQKPWGQFGLMDEDNVYGMLYAKYYGHFTSISNFDDLGANPHFLDPYEYDDISWQRRGLAFAILDDMIWFTNQPSRITDIQLKNTSNLTMEQFKKIAADANQLSSYININFFNTPKYVIQNSSNLESTIETTFNDRTKKVKIKISTPRSFIPNFNDLEGSLENPNWSNNTPLEFEKEFDYSNFKSLHTNVQSGSVDMPTTLPSEASETDIKNALINKNLINDTAAPLAVEDINILSRTNNNADGNMLLTIQIENKKAMDGYFQPDNMELRSFNLHGFKANGLLDNTNPPTRDQSLENFLGTGQRIINPYGRGDIIATGKDGILVPLSRTGLTYIDHSGKIICSFKDGDLTNSSAETFDKWQNKIAQIMYDPEINQFCIIFEQRIMGDSNIRCGITFFDPLRKKLSHAAQLDFSNSDARITKNMFVTKAFSNKPKSANSKHTYLGSYMNPKSWSSTTGATYYMKIEYNPETMVIDSRVGYWLKNNNDAIKKYTVKAKYLILDSNEYLMTNEIGTDGEIYVVLYKILNDGYMQMVKHYKYIETGRPGFDSFFAGNSEYVLEFIRNCMDRDIHISLVQDSPNPIINVEWILPLKEKMIWVNYDVTIQNSNFTNPNGNRAVRIVDYHGKRLNSVITNYSDSAYPQRSSPTFYSTFNFSDGLLYNLKNNGTLTSTNIDIFDDSFSGADYAKVYKTAYKEHISGFDYALSSVTGNNIYMFRDNWSDLWAINTLAKKGTGDWAYKSKTVWMPNHNQAIALSSMVGGTQAQALSVSEMNQQNWKELIHANSSIFYRSLPDDIELENYIIEVTPEPSKGRATVTIKLNKVLNDKGEAVNLTAPSTFVGGQVIIDGFRSQNPTTPKETSINFDLQELPYLSSTISKMPYYFANNKDLLIKNFIMQHLDSIFDNVPPLDTINPQTDLHISYSNKANYDKGLVTINSIELSTFFNADGQLVSHASKGNGVVNYNGSKINNFRPLSNGTSKPQPVDVTIDSSFDKTSITVEDLLKSDVKLKELIKITPEEKVIIWPIGAKIGANSKQEVIDLFSDLNLYSDSRGNAINNIGDVIVEEPTGMNGFSKTYSVTTDIYNYINDKVKITASNIVDNGSDSSKGKLNINIKIPNVFNQETNQFEELTKNLVVDGFKTDTTTIDMMNLNLGINKKPYQITNQYELQEAIIRNNILHNVVTPITKEDIEIYERVDNNINGSITCKVKIINNKAIVNGIPSDLILNQDKLITFNGFQTQAAMELKNIDVNGALSTSVNSIYANQANEAFIKNYVIENCDKFFTNYITEPPLTTNDIEIRNMSHSVKDGSVSFKIVVKGNYIKNDGSYVQPATTGDLTSSKLIKLQGFKTTGLTTVVPTTIVLSNLNDIKPSSLPTTYEQTTPEIVRIRQAILNTNQITNTNGTLELDDISIEAITNRNDVLGSIIVTLGINNGKYWENAKPVTNKQIKYINLRGFNTTEATSIKTGASVGLPEGSQLRNVIASNTMDVTPIKEFIKDNIDQFINNPLPDTNVGNIFIEGLSANTNAGSITFTLKVDRYLSKIGEVVPGGNSKKTISGSVTILGFKTKGLTTSIINSYINTGLTTTLASEASETMQDRLKEIIVNSNFIIGLQEGKRLEPRHLTLQTDRTKANDVMGSLQVKVTVADEVAWEEGKPKAKTFDITMNGFKKIPATGFNDNNRVTVNGDIALKPATIVTTNDIKAFIMTNDETKAKFFVGLPEGFTINDFDVSIIPNSANLTNGTLSININIRKYIDTNGSLVTNGTKETLTPFILSGFKTEGNSTSIASTLVLSGVEEILASSVTNNSSSIKPALLDAIKKNMINISLDKNIDNFSEKDFSFTLVNGTANNATQTLDINLTIKNYYWQIDATPKKEQTVQVTLRGFKWQGQTLRNNSVTSISTTDEWRNKFTNQFKNTDAQALIQANLTTLFNSTAPRDAKVVIIQNQNENIKSGKIKIQFALNKYYDSKGILNQTQSENFNVVIEGFKTNGLTTDVVDKNWLLTEVREIHPETIVDQNSNKIVKQSVLRALKEKVQDLANGINPSTLTENDFTFVVKDHNSKLGTLLIDLTITNNKAWVDGKAKDVILRDINLTGFFTTSPTQYVRTTKPINVSINKYVDDPTIINDLKNYVLANQAKFFMGNVPPSLTIDNISIKIVNTTNGTINATVGLNKYFDVNGELKNDGTILPGAPTYTFTGFRKKPGTTFVNETTITVVGDLANKETKNVSENEIKQYIINHIDLFLINPPTSGLKISDIQLQDKTITEDNISFYLRVDKCIDEVTGEEMNKQITSPNKFTLTGFYKKTSIIVKPETPKNIVNNETFGFDHPYQSFRDDITKDSEKKTLVEHNLKDWVSINRVNAFENFPPSANINKLWIEELKNDSIYIHVEVGIAHPSNGSIIPEILTITVSGFKELPSKIDLSNDINGQKVNTIIENWIKEQKPTQEIKRDLSIIIKAKIDQYLNSDNIPNLWKKILNLITIDQIESAITISTDKNDIEKITEVKLEINNISPDANDCLIGDIHWSINKNNSGLSFSNSSAPWVIIIFICSAVVVFIVFLILISIFIRRTQKKHIDIREIVDLL